MTLLASCAASPPRRQLFAYRFQETECRFVGRRVQRLRHLYRRSEPPIDSPEWRVWLDLEPQRVIERAIADGRGGASTSPSGALPCMTLLETRSAVTAG